MGRMDHGPVERVLDVPAPWFYLCIAALVTTIIGVASVTPTGARAAPVPPAPTCCPCAATSPR